MNAELAAVPEAHREWNIGRFGAAPWSGSCFQCGRAEARGKREDPMRPIGSIRKAWESLRAAGWRPLSIS